MNHAYVFAANRIFSEIPDSWFFDAIFNEIKVDNQLVIFTARVNIILHNIHKFFSTENFDWHLRLLFPVFFCPFVISIIYLAFWIRCVVLVLQKMRF